MKRTAKVLFSAMLVLMFVFSFAGTTPAARADYREDSDIEASFSLWHEKTESEEEGYRPYEDAKNPASVDFGKDADEKALDPTITNLKANGVTITVPEGLYVESIKLKSSENELPLNTYAELSEGENQTFLKVPAKAFEDKDGENILNVLGTAERYVLEVKFHEKDQETVNVSYSAGELSEMLGKLFDSVEVSDAYEVPALSQEQKDLAAKNSRKGFTGWKLVYSSNGISMDVSAGSSIHPYLDCTLEAQWEDIIVVVASQDGDNIYDGTAHKAVVKVNGVPVSDENNTATVTLDGSSVTVEVTNYDTDDSSITNFIKDGKVYTPEVSATYENNTPVDSSKIRIFPVTLTVKPVEIKISSASDEKVYDGMPLTAATPEVWVGGKKQDIELSGENKPEIALVGEDKLTITVSGTITDVNRDPETKEVLSVENTVDYTLSRNRDNYNISVTKGELKVPPRPLTVTVSGGNKPYDGTALTVEGADITSGSLVEGHEPIYTYTGSQTVPGGSKNGANVVIKSGDNDVTANYNVTVVPGDLTVTKLEEGKQINVTVIPKAATKQYDGKPLAATEFEVKSGKLPEGVTLQVTYSGEQTDPGSGESSLTVSKVMQGDADVSANYKITTEKGTLTVTKRPITVTSASASKEHDGKPLTMDKVSYESEDLLSGHTLIAKITGSQTEVGSSSNKFEVTIKDANDKDVTEKYYDVKLVEGTLEVKGKAVTDITVTASASKVYDGTALTLTNKDITVSPALPTGYTISATFSVNSRTAAGKDDVTLTNIVIKDASETNVTNKFNIKVEKGTLEVTKRPLTFTTRNESKVYDGKPLTDKRVPTIEGQLPNHRIKLKFTGSQTKVGSSDNSVEILSIIDMESKESVYDNYAITYKPGKLTVTSANGSTGNNSTDKNAPVETGDTSNIWLWIGLMVAAAAVVVIVVIIIRKNKKDGEDPNKEDQTK